MNKDTLYYDGACPLCRHEIQTLARLSRGNLILQDIHQLDSETDTPGKQALLDRLHLQTADGEWITGLDANIRAWQDTSLGRLWRVLAWPLVRRVSYPAYEYWLRRRARGRQCSIPSREV